MNIQILKILILIHL